MGLNIEELRKQRGLSVEDIAKHLQISPYDYYELEKGNRELSIRIVVMLSNFFGVTIGELLGKEPIKEKKEKETINLSNNHEHNKYNFIVDMFEVTDQELKGAVAFIRALRNSR